MLFASLLFALALTHDAGTTAVRWSYGDVTKAAREQVEHKIIKLGGIINAKATKLPRPNYPATAKAAGMSGEVRVEVTIDILSGKVVKAEAISGQQLLRPAAIEAARRAEFYLTEYVGLPTFAKGILVYHFKLPKRR